MKVLVACEYSGKVREAFERIKANIARTVFSAAEILDVLGTDEEDNTQIKETEHGNADFKDL